MHRLGTLFTPVLGAWTWSPYESRKIYRFAPLPSGSMVPGETVLMRMPCLARGACRHVTRTGVTMQPTDGCVGLAARLRRSTRWRCWCYYSPRYWRRRARLAERAALTRAVQTTASMNSERNPSSKYISRPKISVHATRVLAHVLLSVRLRAVTWRTQLRFGSFVDPWRGSLVETRV